MSDTPLSAHCDLVKLDWYAGTTKLLARVEPDADVGAQVREGWAAYVELSEPHTMAECPYAEVGDSI